MAKFPQYHADSPQVRDVLLHRFGITSYRPHQQKVIDAVLAGRDVLFTLPTGGGKSLAYQLPALMLPGVTVVISPLIALMKDQVDALRAKDIPATFVNSTLSAKQRKDRLQLAITGQVKLLFITPERFRSSAFLEVIKQLQVSCLAFDEAHCISMWGHDFRPDYSQLQTYRKMLGNPPTIGLTATATPEVAADIVTQLNLQDPLIERAGIERESLFMAATSVYDQQQKIDRLAQIIRAIDGPGIVYGTVIRDLNHIQEGLRKQGISTLLYHGELSAHERKQMQERFMQSTDQVVLATNAFGMGIDKADVRFVVHVRIPRNLEAWVQEVGRGGRDGKPAWCELIYLQEDIAIQQNFIQWANPSREFVVGVYRALLNWGERIVTKDINDLRDELLYKNKADNRVDICLKWLDVLSITSGALETGNLQIVQRMEPEDLPQIMGKEAKHKADLQGLLGIMQFALNPENQCRRQLVAEHFKLDEIPTSCHACDVCQSRDAQLASDFSTRKPGDVKTTGARDDHYHRGDWVRIDGRHVGQVVKVLKRGRDIELVVESAGDLRQRNVNIRRQCVEKIKH
ncbi:MAG: RecQ family ATP-dependent DNA helicase [Phycisphaeraceae bacterium]|nr:RecQ family ATP-dependent DNA helicase [Phycisphaeraceae bacterium]